MEHNTETDVPQLPTFETAFLLLKVEDGPWKVLTDLTQPFAVSRNVTRPEIRVACTEVAHLLQQQDIAGMVIAAMAQNSPENSQRAEAEVRDAGSGSSAN